MKNGMVAPPITVNESTEYGERFLSRMVKRVLKEKKTLKRDAFWSIVVTNKGATLVVCGKQKDRALWEHRTAL